MERYQCDGISATESVALMCPLCSGMMPEQIIVATRNGRASVMDATALWTDLRLGLSHAAEARRSRPSDQTAPRSRRRLRLMLEEATSRRDPIAARCSRPWPAARREVEAAVVVSAPCVGVPE